MVKWYKVERVNGEVFCTVFASITKYQLKHVVLHSPTGLETGYGGSGPADLAASILANYLNASPASVVHEWKGHYTSPRSSLARRVVALHQDFKSHFIVPNVVKDGESYIITGDAIDRWLQEKELGSTSGTAA